MAESFDNPALQLFHLELQELLEQVELMLNALADSASKSDFKRLCRSVRLIHQGAVEMKLDSIEQRTTAFLKILLPDSNVPEGELSSAQLATLTQLFQELQAVDLPPALAAKIRSDDPKSAASPSVDWRPEPEPLIEGHDSEPIELIEPLGASPLAGDIRQVLLQNDIAEVMAQLHQSVIHLTGDALVTEVMLKVNALIGWGEVLDWPELVTLAQAIARGIETHPEAAPSIISVGVLGIQALHQSALLESCKGENRSESGASQRFSERSSDSLTPFGLDSAQKFIWQSHQAIFVLDSTAIAETLIPQKSQVSCHGNQRFFQWDTQKMPIVRLTQQLGQQWMPAWGTCPVEGHATEVESALGPVMILETIDETIALEIEMEQFIRTPELIITPVASVPAFYLGQTVLDGHDALCVIDVLELLTASSAPISRSMAEPMVERAPESIEYSDTDSTPTASEVSPMISVLVVDDSRTIRYVVQRAFEQLNYLVIQAKNGLEALQKLQQHPEIALVVSDVEMPHLNGFELVSRCRRHPEWKELPIIILSQCSTDQHHQLALQFGADAYLPKPFDDETFISTVASLLDRS